jgi:hypothetical protein
MDKALRRVAGIKQNVFRRSTCHSGIWTKPLAFAADAMEIQSTLIWKSLEVRVLAGTKLRGAFVIITTEQECEDRLILSGNRQLLNTFNWSLQCRLHRARASVRLDSGLVQIAISFIEHASDRTAAARNAARQSACIKLTFCAGNRIDIERARL